jgi:hypothetical protein
MRWALVLALAAGCTHPGTAPQAPHEDVPASTPSVEPAPGAPGAAPVQPAPIAVPAVPPKPQPVKIKVMVRSTPPKAIVFWGKKKLGETPVTLERPRDSGPVDLVVKLEGHFPVHTRAYSFRNDTVYVKLTKLEERMSILGAKEPPPPPPTAPPPEGAVPVGATPAPAPDTAAPPPVQ